VSHIAERQAELKSLDAIERAANRLGGVLVRDQKTYRWFGKWVGDTPMPAGMSKADLGRCTHAIRFPGKASYEVGLREQADGSFSLAWDWWHSGGLLPIMGDTSAGKFVQAYGIEAAKREAVRRGYSAREVALDNGDIQLVMAVR
jgi:hypothetical protein